MNKLLLTVLVVLLGWVSLIPETLALPDKEHVQKTLKKADMWVKCGMNVYEKEQEYQRYVTGKINGAKGLMSAVKNGDIMGALDAVDSVSGGAISGETGAIRDNISGATGFVNDATGAVNGAVSSVNGAVSKAKNKIPGMIQNVNDIEQNRKDISKTYYGEYGDTPDIEVYNKHKEVQNAVLREYIADMYAKALSGRVAIAKEKAAGPKEIDTSTTRALITATRNMSMKTAGRLRRILEYESSIYQYNTAVAAENYQNVKASAPEQDNSGGEGGKS